MRKIDYLEVLKAIRTCVEEPYYTVGLFTKTVRDAECAFGDILRATKYDEEERNAIDQIRRFDYRIVFKNGSYIKCLKAGDNARGYRFNRVLYSGNIDREILFTVVRNTEYKRRKGKDYGRENYDY